MKNLKSILLVLAFGLMSNGVFAQSKTIKVDKKSINSTPQTKASTKVTNSEVQKKQVKTTQPVKTVPTQTAPAQTYKPTPTNSKNNKSNQTQPKRTAPAQSKPLKSKGNNGTIPASSMSKGKGESKK